MLQKIRANKKAQMGIALVLGLLFGIFFQRGGRTKATE